MLTADQIAKLPDLLASLKKRAEDPIACCDDAKTAVALAEDLLSEVNRLRARVHEVASEGDKRGARAESQLAKLRALMHEAGRRHGDEMESLGQDRGCHISGFGQATAAVIIGERDEALAEVERLRGELDAIKKNRLISAIFGHHPGAPRPFGLYRRQDETGVSGTGMVALGAEFPDGMVVLRWTSAFPTSVVFHERGIESVEAVHGHGGKTQVVWLSDELEPLADAEQTIERLAAQVREVLELCDDAQQVIGQRGFLAVDAIRAVFAAVDALDASTPIQDQADEDLVEPQFGYVSPADLASIAYLGGHFPNPDVSFELVDDEHPERICKRCGGPNVRAWCAPSPLWNQVMRGGDINNPDRFGGIVCPVCFAALAEEAGVAQRWRFYAQKVHVELATVTPSGRVWNEKTWLWEEPEDPAARSETSVEPCPAEPHRCPSCGELTVYQSFSGGREFYCKGCDNHGMYEAGEAPPRAQMLADGRVDELRAQMREEIVRRKAEPLPDTRES